MCWPCMAIDIPMLTQLFFFTCLVLHERMQAEKRKLPNGLGSMRTLSRLS